jgi:DNA-binding NtrC family response regulator
MQRLYEDIEEVARRPIPVVIVGPTGAGKELVARAIHQASGRTGRYVALNVHALPEGLADAELFGVVRGAYTGATNSRPGLMEAASGGTLLLDEAGDLTKPLQARLLRALESGQIRPVGGTAARPADFRLLICTQTGPTELVQGGHWRADFRYRVAGFVLTVPSLVDHAPDIPVLARHALRERRGEVAWEEVELLLLAHHWPGNVRELERVLVCADVLARGGVLTGEHVARAIVQVGGPPGRPGGRTIDEVVQAHVLSVLKQTGFNINASSRILGISRSGLYQKLRRWRLAEVLREPVAVFD